MSVLHAAPLIAVLGSDPLVTWVLLQTSDDTAASRLSSRESGQSLARHLERSRAANARLDAECADDVVRVDTDSKAPNQLAEEIAAIVGW